jgi:polar amino acid transport system substrate-binding protein
MRGAFSENRRPHRAQTLGFAFVFFALTLLTTAQAALAASANLDRIKAEGKITLGYRVDAQPFSYRDRSDKPAGYSVALCQQVVDQVKAELGLGSLTVQWVPVTLADRFDDLKQGKVALLCGADTATLARRKEVAFSIPIFPGGIGAMLRNDAPSALRDILAEAPPPSHPIWRGSPARTFLERKTFSVVKGTTGESWLTGRLKEFDIAANVAPVDNYEAGIQRVLNGSSDALFADRAILLEAARHSSSEDVLDRLFTYEPFALALRRDDDDFRLIVDRTLSRLYKSKEFRGLYAAWLGKPDDSAITFFRLTALPD